MKEFFKLTQVASGLHLSHEDIFLRRRLWVPSCFLRTWRSLIFRRTLYLLSVIILSVASDKKPDLKWLNQKREHIDWYDQAVQGRWCVASGMTSFRPQTIQPRLAVSFFPRSAFFIACSPFTRWLPRAVKVRGPGLQTQKGKEKIFGWHLRQSLIASYGLWLDQEPIHEPITWLELYDMLPDLEPGHGTQSRAS